MVSTFGPRLVPNTGETDTYAKTIVSLMTRYKHPDGKFLIVGCCIANQTDVTATFNCLIKAQENSLSELKEYNIKIWIRRAGPNYLDGFRKIKKKAAAQRLGLPMKVYGPESHITAVVPMVLGLQALLEAASIVSSSAPPVRKTIVVKEQEGTSRTGSTCWRPHHRYRQCTHNTTCRTEPCRACWILISCASARRHQSLPWCSLSEGFHHVKFHWTTEEVQMLVYTSVTSQWKSTQMPPFSSTLHLCDLYMRPRQNP